MTFQKATLFLCALATLAIVVPSAQATESNRKTVVTFNEPVEIPGLVLEPGSYVFTLLDSNMDRDIVEIFDRNEDHLYANLLAIPDERLKPTSKTVITFEHWQRRRPALRLPQGARAAAR